MCRENIPSANGTYGDMDNYAENEALNDWRQLRILRCLLTRKGSRKLGREQCFGCENGDQERAMIYMGSVARDCCHLRRESIE
jgi:hypothetical protein